MKMFSIPALYSQYTFSGAIYCRPEALIPLLASEIVP
jgi:hypothetical protein